MRAFSRTDLTASVVVLSVLAALVIAGLSETRRTARLDEDIANLQRLGVATGAYGADHADLNWGFSWVEGETYEMLGLDGEIELVTPASDYEGGALQAVHLIRLLGDRIGADGMPTINNWVAHVLYSHLPLQEYQGTRIPVRTVASTADTVRLNWQDDPKGNFDQGFWLPLQPAPVAVNRRWPYSSSYRQSSSAWDRSQSDLSDLAAGRRIRQSSTHNTYVIPTDADVGRVSQADVEHPSGKVHVHDSHQRHFGQRTPYFGLPEARIPLLMFDGAVGVRQTADANPGWHPGNDLMACDLFWYQPASWEPATTSGEFSDLVYGYYRWTRGGLKGRDYGGLPLATGQADPGTCDL